MAQLGAMPPALMREADKRILALKKEPVPDDAEILPSKLPGKRPRHPLYRILVAEGPDVSIYTGYRILYVVNEDQHLVSIQRIASPGDLTRREE